MLISVIVPVYNVEKYIYRCVDSILSQTFSDFELILVDDGSPDNCGAICDEYEKTDSRVHVIHKKNGGLSDARNAGIDWAFNNNKSKYITFIDSDDWVHPEYLSVLYNSIKNSKTRVSVVSYERMFSCCKELNRSNAGYVIWKVEDLYSEKKKNFITAWGKLFYIEDFRHFRFPVGKIHEDEYVIYKILFNTKTIAYINEPFYFYFENVSGITSNPSLKSWMDQIYAIGEQVVFFEEKWPKAFAVALDTYLRYLGRTYNFLLETGDKSTKKKELRRIIAATLKKYSLSKTVYPYYYELLYPKEMKLFWMFEAQKNKILAKKTQRKEK